MTAAELMAQLEADPEWVAARDRRAEELRRKQAEWARISAPLVEELHQLGFPVTSIWDFVNTDAAYVDALPTLVKHLQREYPPDIREAIARALAVPEARFARPVLFREFKAEPNDWTRQGLALALANTTLSKNELDEILPLLRDPRHGPSRGLLLDAVERLAGEDLGSLLDELEADPDLTLEIKEIRKRQRRRQRRRKKDT